MKIKIEKISKIPRKMVEKRIFSLFLLIFLAFSISFFVFFKYQILLSKAKIEPKKVEKLDTKKLEEILKILERREKTFEKIEKIPNFYKIKEKPL